jgi:hypothetical protein
VGLFLGEMQVLPENKLNNRSKYGNVCKCEVAGVRGLWF